VSEVLLRWYPQLLLGSLCAGLAAANAVRPGVVLAIFAGLAAVGAVVVRPAIRVPFLAAALVAAGWCWGAARLDDLDQSALLPHVGETARAVAVVTAPPRHGMYAIRVPADVRRFSGLRVRERVLLELPLGRAPPQGAILELIGSLQLPPTSDSGSDERGWLRRQGIAVVLDGKVWRQVGRRGGFGGVGDRLRRHIERTLAPGVGGERGAVLAGVVLGADEGLSPELRDAFRASGLYHLLAVSGQNVVFISIGVLAVAWLLGIPRGLGELGVLGAIVAYTLAVGWQPSVVRAGVAGGVASLAWLAARPRDRWYALLLGAAVLLAWNPYALLDPGFELSFVAVAAIFVGVPRLQRVLEGYPVPRQLGLVLVVATVCGLATAPILWLRFGAVPLYSVPANAMAELSVGPMLGLGLLSSVLHPLLPSVSMSIGWLAGWPAAYLAFCARFWSSVPGAQITSGKALAGMTLLGALLGLVVRRSIARPAWGARAERSRTRTL
jgi:competence protein ComEC